MKKILLVEDSETDRAVLRRYLSRNPGEALEVQEATTLAEAVLAFQQYRPDCVLVDYNLPDGTGLEVLERFKQLVPVELLCVVLITGIDSGELAVQALNNGALDYLIKHKFDQDMLLKVVRHAVERNEWRQYQARYHSDLERVNQELRQSLAQLTATRQELADTNGNLLAAHAEVQTRNRALDAANRQLARTNQDLDNFVYAASHDLKQPVQNLQGLFDELCRIGNFEDEESQLLATMTRASLHDLLTTIDDLSVLVQDTRQPLSASQEDVNLAELLDDIQQALAPQLRSVEAVVHYDFQTLPIVHYNRGHLRTILLNLLSNALRYRHPERAPHVQVRSWCAPEGHAMLSVTDNGLGIDLAQHEQHLFQLFHRFHPDAAEGTGVGLFLVNRIVESNGGEVQVESTVGEGTTFRVVLN